MLDPKSPNHSNGVCLIVEDQKATIDFLRETVRSTFPKMHIVVQSTLKDAQEWIKSNEAVSLALVDLGLPDGSGVEVIRQINRQSSNTNIVVVTIYDDDAFLFEALAAGATGYLLKAEEPKFLAEILSRIHRNEPPLSPAIARRLLTHFKPAQAPANEGAELTARERETLTLLARGLTVAESAKQMGLSAQTVAGYVKIIYQKLHVSNRVEATREAIRRGLV